MYYFSGNGFSFPLGKKTYVMGILNITSDSFFDGGKYADADSQIKRAKEIEEQGAHILDIGAQSTRPGHVKKTADEEIELLSPVIESICKKTDIPVSVDTYYPAVALFALENGARIINDVSGVFNPQMAEIVKKYNAGWIITHTGFADSSTEIDYKGRVTESVNGFFDDVTEKCVSSGIKKAQIMLDMGIGFGKGYEDNLTLLKNIKFLKRKEIALMTAVSCKRVIKISSNAVDDDLLYGTIGANAVAVAGGTDFVRVHHVRENVLALKTCDEIIRR